jgi:GNAT superfamily N-acetyltransferase
MIEIKRVSAKELFEDKNFLILGKEYEEESAIEGLPPINLQYDIYYNLEKVNALDVIGAYKDGYLIGFIIAVSSITPHYGFLAIGTESFFVSKEHRKNNTGKKLILELEEIAKEKEATVIMMASPINGALHTAAKGFGFKPTNTMFTKVLK